MRYTAYFPSRRTCLRAFARFCFQFQPRECVMRRFILATVIVLFVAMSADSQTFRGAINGTVTDPSGAVVPRAQIKATNKATSIDYASESTSDGHFAFQDLPVGTYKVSISANGFPTLEVDNILVGQGAIYTLH